MVQNRPPVYAEQLAEATYDARRLLVPSERTYVLDDFEALLTARPLHRDVSFAPKTAGRNDPTTLGDQVDMQKKLKVLAGVTIGVAALGGAAVAGALPDQADNGLDRAEENVGIELPATRESHPTREDHPGGAPEVVVTSVAVTPELPDAAAFGQSVAADAQAGVPQEDGRAFGEQVSSAAQEAHQPDVPTAEDNPGTEHSEAGADNAPDEIPTADDNPGTEHRP